MKVLKIDGKLYTEYEWLKPEESDFPFGHWVVAIYPHAVCPHPCLAVAIDDKKFKSFGIEQSNQPLLVITLPCIGKKDLLTVCPEYFEDMYLVEEHETDRV